MHRPPLYPRAKVRPLGIIGNRTQELPACSAVPQPSAPPRTPLIKSATVYSSLTIFSGVISKTVTQFISFTNHFASCQMCLRHQTNYLSYTSQGVLGKQRVRTVSTTPSISYVCSVPSQFWQDMQFVLCTVAQSHFTNLPLVKYQVSKTLRCSVYSAHLIGQLIKCCKNLRIMQSKCSIQSEEPFSLPDSKLACKNDLQAPQRCP